MRFIGALICAICMVSVAFGSEFGLDPLLEEALVKNPTVRAMDARARAQGYRVPQAGALPDPMLMTGYQDEGWGEINYGESPDAQIMTGLSQMIPYPGKRGFKEAMARADLDAALAVAEEARVRTVERVRELYVDMYASYRKLDVLQGIAELYGHLEDASLARYSSGMGMQQEALMAQREKYMLREREAMIRERIGTSAAMLGQAVGRASGDPQIEGRPMELRSVALSGDAETYISTHLTHAPMIKEREAMLRGAQARADMARREYYPDITIGATYSLRGEPYENMWGLTGTVNLPVYYGSKLGPAVDEAQALVDAAKAELEATSQMLASTIRESVVMARSAESLMGLYRDSLIPKARQGADAAVSAYSSGRGAAGDAISSLRGVMDAEFQYWDQFSAFEKAVIRLEASAGIMRVDIKGAEK